jgi:hypothetical protein
VSITTTKWIFGHFVARRPEIEAGLWWAMIQVWEECGRWNLESLTIVELVIGSTLLDVCERAWISSMLSLGAAVGGIVRGGGAEIKPSLIN